MLVVRNGRRVAAAVGATPPRWGRLNSPWHPAQATHPILKLLLQQNGCSRLSLPPLSAFAGLPVGGQLHGRCFSNSGFNGHSDSNSPAEGQDLLLGFQMRLDAAPLDAEVAMEVFTELQQTGDDVQPSNDLISTLLITLSEQKRLTDCLQVLDYSRGRDVRPDSATYAIVLKELSIGKHLEEVLQVFEAMRHDTPIDDHWTWVYTIALLAATELKRHDLVFQIFKSMHKSGVDVSNSYLNVLGTACKSKQHDLVFKVLGQMLANDVYMTAAYTSTLGAASNTKQHELVCDILSYMVKNAVHPTVEMYDTVLKSCARVGDVKTALEIQRVIQQRGLLMTERTFYFLIRCATKTAHWELALEVLTNMQRQGLKPTMSMYNVALMECVKRKQWGRTVEFYDIMPPDLRAKLDGWDLKAVILGHTKAGSEELKLRAVEIFNEHKENCDTNEYTAALTILLETNQLEAVLVLVEDMKTRGLPSTTATLRIEILAQIRSGAVGEADTLLEASAKRMRDSRDCYQELIRFYSGERQDLEKVERLQKRMAQHNSGVKLRE
ncbi:hypothetical protein BBJ28_00008145 [Nothophytophthora sp. Chile5]|nr:hypothetical protein BBJ28_00008145 [Nothophytophthora sp. Chile5]